MGAIRVEDLEKNPMVLQPTKEYLAQKAAEAQRTLRRICEKLGSVGLKMEVLPDRMMMENGYPGDARMNMRTLLIQIRQGWAALASASEKWTVIGHEVLHSFVHPKTLRLDTEEQRAIAEEAVHEHDTLTTQLHNTYSDTLINRVGLFMLGADPEYGGFAKGMMESYGILYKGYVANYVRWLFHHNKETKADIIRRFPKWEELSYYHTEIIPTPSGPQGVQFELRGFDAVMGLPVSPKEQIRWMGYPFEDLGIITHTILQYMAVLDFQWGSRDDMFKWVDTEPFIGVINAEFPDFRDKLKRLYLLVHFPTEVGLDRRAGLIEYCKIMAELFLRTATSSDWSAGILICDKCKWVDMDHNFKLTELGWRKFMNKDIDEAFEVVYNWKCPMCGHEFEKIRRANINGLLNRGYITKICRSCGRERMKVTGIDIYDWRDEILIRRECTNKRCTRDDDIVLNPFFGIECPYCGGWSHKRYHRYQEIVKNMNLGSVPGPAGENPYMGQDIPAPIGTYKFWLWARCTQCENEKGERTVKFENIRKRQSPIPEQAMEDLIARYW